MEKFEIKTKTGFAKVTRTKDKATLVEERTNFGFKEKSTTEITRLDDSCMHFLFGSETTIREILKTH